ncbi:Tubulin-specific chaperone D [Balamuthia mandrillaris]
MEERALPTQLAEHLGRAGGASVYFVEAEEGEQPRDGDVDAEEVADQPNRSFRSFMEEEQEVKQLLGALRKRAKEEAPGSQDAALSTEVFVQFSRFSQILEKYQEQPFLLDPHLSAILDSLMNIIREERDRALKVEQELAPRRMVYAVSPFISHVFGLVHTLSTVRGAKTVVKYFPHTVSDLLSTFQYLQLLTEVEKGSQPAPTPEKLKEGEEQELTAGSSSQTSQQQQLWRMRYVLLLWLSVILYLPFDLSTIIMPCTESSSSPSGSSSASSSSSSPLVNELLSTGKECLEEAATTRDAAAALLSRLLTRPDVVRMGHLSNFLSWSHQRVFLSSSASSSTSSQQNIFLVTGVLTTLSGIFKKGKREELLKEGEMVMLLLGGLKAYGLRGNLLQRKLCIKLMQRLGMTFLRPVVASWRYQRNRKTLLAGQDASTSGVVEEVSPEEPAADATEVIEDVLGELLSGLSDKDTVVRWSSAKGIGRITERLPKEMGDDIVQSVFELCSPSENENAWHGACLALAELARRGLLLAEHVRTSIPLIKKALCYDEKRSAKTLGANVRDAACYVCWAFAKAYDPEFVREHVFKDTHLASALLLNALFDRETNCRRAASAALQENIGRLGQITADEGKEENFPHGIAIVRKANFFSLGNIRDSYVKISFNLAKLKSSSENDNNVWRRPIIDHLYQHRISHWDARIREYSAASLAELVRLEPSYFVETVLPHLIPLTSSRDLDERHGSILAVASITLSLSTDTNFVWRQSTSFSSLEADIAAIVPNLTAARLFTGRGGELIRKAVCLLIESVAKASLSLSTPAATASSSSSSRTSLASLRQQRQQKKTKRQVYAEVLDECLKHPNEEISQDFAVKAFRAFQEAYHVNGTGEQWRDKHVLQFVAQLNEADSPFVRRGYALALGALPAPLLDTEDGKRCHAVVSALLDNCVVSSSAAAASSASASSSATDNNTEQPQRPPYDDVQTRQNAAISLGNLADCLSSAAIRTHFGAIASTLLKALEDYTTDGRGDVGSWVRKAAVNAMVKWTIKVCQLQLEDKVAEDLWNAELCKNLMAKLVGQCVEKGDRIRQNAGEAFQQLLYHTRPEIPFIPHREDLLKLFPILPTALNWAASSVVYPRAVQLLRYEEYRHEVICSLAVSIGGGTVSVARDAEESLCNYLGELKQEPVDDSDLPPTLKLVSHEMAIVLRKAILQRDDRLIIPMLKTLTAVLASGHLSILQPSKNAWSKNVLKLVSAVVRQSSKDAIKLLESVKVLCGLLSFGDTTRTQALDQLMLLLSHPFPKLRSFTADTLAAALLKTDETTTEENKTAILHLLVEPEHWLTSDLSVVHEKRKELCQLLGIAAPHPIITPPKRNTSPV